MIREVVAQTKGLFNRIALALCLAILAWLMFGCGTFGNGKIDNPLGVTPYEAGRVFVFIDVVTEPIQPDELKAVTSTVYNLASMNINESIGDAFVMAEIERLYSDSTPEFRQVVFSLYENLTLKLISQIDANASLPEIEVLSEFNRGITDALALYKPEDI